MTRYMGVLEYMGTPFVGWQRQPEGLSVQALLEEAIFKFTHEVSSTYACGRTDSGVHALGQVVHFDINKYSYDEFKIRDAINYYLKPYPIALLDVKRVADDFHARFSAQARSYEYHILNRYAPLTLMKNRVWRIARPLDIQSMQYAANALIGTHDFTTFRATECKASSPIKTLDVFDIKKVNDTVICFVKARSFLHHQVRNMVGTIVNVGLGKWSVERFVQALAAKDRRQGGPMAPACGLYFYKAYY
jgi:tRNA pseudouridine38-40 synthase